MRRLIIQRLAILPVVLIGAFLVSFLIIQLAPGDPIEMELRRLGVVATQTEIDALRSEFGIDNPFYQRFASWWWRAVHLDFGTSIATGRKVIDEIWPRLPVTLTLACTALSLIMTGALILGVVAAMYQGRSIDRVIRVLTILSVSTPSYWLGLMLLWFFAIVMGTISIIPSGTWQDYVLPSLTLAAGSTFFLGRIVRERVIATTSQDFVRLARAKGLDERTVLRRHILPNSLAPLMTLAGLTFGYLLGGSVIVESIFSLPGLGQLVLDSIAQRDFPVLQAYLVLMAGVYVLVNLVADALSLALDPGRRRAEGADQ